VIKSLNIAYCLPELRSAQDREIGGLDAAYLQQMYISSGLRARGHQLTFLYPKDLRDMVCTDNLQELKQTPRSWTQSRSFEFASRVTWRLQSGLGIPYLNVFSNYRYYDAGMHCLPGHEIVQERYSLYVNGIAMACKRLKIPYVLFFDADQLMELDYLGKPITGVLRRRAAGILRYNLGVARGVICVSEQSKDHLINKWKVPEEKIAVFPNAVDVNRFKPDLAMREQVRGSLGIGSNPVIFFVGNFYKWHDVATLLTAFSEVAKNHPDARLVLVGDGTERQAMVQRSHDLGIAELVMFTGLVDHEEIPGLISASDIAVAPVPPMEYPLWLSPMKVFEYMASGVAIVATGMGQVTEVIRHGINGLLVPPGESSEMAAALNGLISDTRLRLQLGKQARQDAINKHSWEQYIVRLERLYFTIRNTQN
jgi:glycosyltransferase involved in cell wall biosynthesis